MQVLVFDTSLDKTYITLALQDNKGEATTYISKKIKSEGKKYHSAYLVSQINNMMQTNVVELKNLDGIGVNIGAGSFTGIRVCLTVARIIAQQLNLRLVGVSSSEILSQVLGSENLSAVALDAKMDMFYYYNPYKKNTIDLISREELLKNAKEMDKGVSIITDTSTCKFLKDNGIETINFEEKNYPLGEILADITIKRLKSVSKITQCHWSIIKPLYIQNPQVLKGERYVPYVIDIGKTPFPKEEISPNAEGKGIKLGEDSTMRVQTPKKKPQEEKFDEQKTAQTIQEEAEIIPEIEQAKSAQQTAQKPQEERETVHRKITPKQEIEPRKRPKRRASFEEFLFDLKTYYVTIYRNFVSRFRK
jgi:tRNA threonylcarbamoyl adenosine modification protein YeaZ